MIQRLSKEGIQYGADDSAAAFLDALSSTYVARLRDRAEWMFEKLGGLDERGLAEILKDSLGRWRGEFAVLATEGESE